MLETIKKRLLICSSVLILSICSTHFLNSAKAQLTDDSHKWFITVLYDDSYASNLLRHHFRTNEYLLALANPLDKSKSWSHYREFYVNDPAQRFRIEQYKYKNLPCIVVQPPLNGSYGDPKTVILQVEGYNGDYYKVYKFLKDGIEEFARNNYRPQPNNPQEQNQQRQPPNDRKPPVDIVKPEEPSITYPPPPPPPSPEPNKSDGDKSEVNEWINKVKNFTKDNWMMLVILAIVVFMLRKKNSSLNLTNNLPHTSRSLNVKIDDDDLKDIDLKKDEALIKILENLDERLDRLEELHKKFLDKKNNGKNVENNSNNQ